MLTKKTLLTNTLLIIGIIVIINILSNTFSFRLDFTEEGQYTLSESTEKILESLEEPVTVTAYFSDNLPPDISRVKNDFQDLLIEYERRSGGNVVYKMVNPLEDEGLETEAQQKGVMPVVINVREKDQMKQQRAYIGAVLTYSDRNDVIPVIQPGAAMEYALTSGIRKISLKEKKKIGFLQGHGEPNLMALQQLRDQLAVMYNVIPLRISDTSGISTDYKAVLIIAPTDTIPQTHFEKLDAFLGQGGNLIVALNRVKVNFQTLMGEEQYTGVSSWLAAKGIVVNPDFVIDNSCGTIGVRQNLGFVMNIEFPYFPLITRFHDHPVTGGLETVMLNFASSLGYDNLPEYVTASPLLSTSGNAGIEKPPLMFDVNRSWQPADFQKKSIPLAAVFEGPLAGNEKAKMIVIGDGDFIINGEGQNAQQIQPDNVSFISNTVDWLVDDIGLIELRTKSITFRPIDASLSEENKLFIKYANFLLPIVLIALYGIIRMRMRKIERKKWMNEDYG